MLWGKLPGCAMRGHGAVEPHLTPLQMPLHLQSCCHAVQWLKLPAAAVQTLFKPVPHVAIFPIVCRQQAQGSSS